MTNGNYAGKVRIDDRDWVLATVNTLPGPTYITHDFIKIHMEAVLTEIAIEIGNDTVLLPKLVGYGPKEPGSKPVAYLVYQTVGNTNVLMYMGPTGPLAWINDQWDEEVRKKIDNDVMTLSENKPGNFLRGYLQWLATQAMVSPYGYLPDPPNTDPDSLLEIGALHPSYAKHKVVSDEVAPTMEALYSSTIHDIIQDLRKPGKPNITLMFQVDSDYALGLKTMGIFVTYLGMEDPFLEVPLQDIRTTDTHIEFQYPRIKAKIKLEHTVIQHVWSQVQTKDGVDLVTLYTKKHYMKQPEQPGAYISIYQGKEETIH